MKIGLTGKIIFTVSAMTVSGLVFAHSGAKGIVKERMNMMSDIGDKMKVIGTMIKTGDFNPAAAHEAAIVIRVHAAGLQDVFPENSLDKPSEALPAIWSDWEEFLTIGNQMGAAADTLAEMTNGSSDLDAIKDQFRKLGKSCSSCHEKFRLKK